jgi:hypothetical protein
MKWIPLLSLAILFVAMSSVRLHCQTARAAAAEPAQQLAHVSNTFSFIVNASLHDAAALFGPEGERAWADDDWNPQFVFPTPAKDIEGAVFTVGHGEQTAVWVNTVFDVEDGRMQYVYVLADLLATTIDVRLHPIDLAHARVDVTYVRTALRPEGNEHVLHMGRHDGQQGPEWATSINAYLLHRSTPR